MHGDTGRVPFGMGTYGCRSLAVGGTAIVKAVDKVIAKGKKIAAHLLEAADTDIEFEDGKFKVAGTDKKVPFGDVALTAYVPHNYPLDKLEPGLNENAFYDPTNFTYPAGTHICEVEVDPDTGKVKIEQFTAVDDFGNIINPMIVEGQVHGGIAQGLGQAMMEGCALRPAVGPAADRLLHGLRDAARDDLPSFKVATTVTPCTPQPARREGLRRGRRDRLAAGLMNALTDALGVVRPRDAGDAGARLARRQRHARLNARGEQPCTHSTTSGRPAAMPTQGRAAGADARYLAGGQSLIQAMKLRLSQSERLVDLGGDRRAEGHQGRRQRRRRSAR